MYHNNNYSGDGGGGNFPNFINQNNFPPFAGSPTGQPSLQQQGGIKYYEEPNGMMDTSNEYQPELPMFNQQAFMQNGFNAQFANPQAFSAPSTPSANAPMNISTRAAQLKAKLLESRRPGSTPPVAVIASKVDGTAVASSGAPVGRNADSVDDLIQQYSGPAEQHTKTQVQTTNGSSNKKTIEQREDWKTTALGNPALVTKSEGQNGKSIGKTLDMKCASNESLGEVSEGEIVEDTVTASKKSTPTEPKKPQLPLNTNEKASLVRRGPRDEELPKPSYREVQYDAASATRPTSSNTNPRGSRIRDDSRDEDQRDSRRRYSDHNDRRSDIRTDNYSFRSRRGSRDQIDDDRKIVVKKESKREDTRSSLPQIKQEIRKPVIRETRPTLEQFLADDADLREWLEITGYHNREYRDKILLRRRKIAALDAQKAQLLHEMEVEERGGLPASSGTPTLTAAMAPPPSPTKQSATSAKRPDIKKSESMSELDRNRHSSNKRVYSPPERDESGGAKKIARTEERRIEERRVSEPRPRIKEEEDGSRGMRSFGYDSYRSDRRENREFDGRGRGARGRSFSPSSRGSRDRGYGDFDVTPPNKDSRPFEIVGGYRGRAYDPNFRGRGRGRGRGDFPGGRGSFRPDFYGDDFDRDREESFGSKIANSQPYKDRRGLQRGGKGETRYFIVKSFNEENVLKCIDDSIWTTQKENGPVLKEAFETCKDVILVFSINKSRAFQGYARMESLPGSVSTPPWQKAINWETAGAFRVRWIVVCSTLFRRVGHLKNSLNENQAVLIGKDGQEIEENCGTGLIELIDEEFKEADKAWHRAWNDDGSRSWS